MNVKYSLVLIFLLANSCMTIPYKYVWVSDRDSQMDLHVGKNGIDDEKITNDLFVEYGMSWSPDGKCILFAKQVNKHYDLFLYHMSSKEIEQLTSDSLDQTGPSFSPDGKSIVYASNSDHRLADIYTMDLSTRQTKRITNNNRLDGSPTFHPDGVRIYYSSFVGYDSTNGITNSEIFVTDTSGNNHTQLTNRPGNDGALDISPNGKQIACHYFMNGKADIYVLDLDGQHIRQLTNDTLDNRWPRWSPDGRYLAFTRVMNGNSDIWVMTSKGKKKKPYVVSPGRDEILEFRPVK